MPSDLSTYLALLKLVDDTSKDLRLSHLTASDKNVLLALTSFADKNNEAIGFTYIRYCQIFGEDNAVSGPSFQVDRCLVGIKGCLKIGLPGRRLTPSALNMLDGLLD